MFNGLFDIKYSEILGKRASTFRKTFTYLQSLTTSNYTIVETGTVRMENNFIGDGCSTIMFDEFVSLYGGTVYTVDIDPNACSLCRNLTSPNTIVTISDSVLFLSRFQNAHKIDLLYLDSFDFDPNNPHPSSLHHVKELAAVWASLKPGCLIVVDDNFEDGSGKGAYVKEFMLSVNAELLFDEYQLGFVKKY
jgi:hypothetical protein